jgi:tetratricopeptide (TPR) repeat protein
VTDERWPQVKALFQAAVERPADERDAFLAAAAGDDAALRREVESLLASDASDPGFLDRLPVVSESVLADPLAALQTSMDSTGHASQLIAGDRLGPYEVVSLLGVGGMGEVYRAGDTRLGRTVAIKLLGSHGRVGRALHEARAVSALNHPNIVTLYDVGSDAGIDFLVFEFVAGRPLSDFVTGNGMAVPDLLDAGSQIAEALAAAHQAGIVHRDIKPSNIMVTPEARIKVLDFGVAKVAAQLVSAAGAATMAVSATTPGLIVGTVSYMSPEQTRGEPLDGRSDVFSLGCVLYEAATCRLPFRGASALGIMHAIATAEPPRPSTLRPELPAEFDDVIVRAMAKDRNDRYASASELALALRALRGETRTVVRQPAERRPETFVGRDQELDTLRRLAQRAVDGAGTIVFVTGESGYGKSALAAAFLSDVAREHPQALIARGTCVEQYGPSEAYLPFLDALTGLLGGPHRQRVMAVLRRHSPTWCLQFPGAFGSTRTLEQLQQEVIGATKERMLLEFGDAVAALTASEPLILLLEDLHWSDVASVDLLRHLGGRVGQHRLFVFGTFRGVDAERADHPITTCARQMLAHKLCDELKLTPLGPDDIARYLDARFRPNELPSELAAVIFRRTEGHPLFADALVQLLVDRGLVASSDRGWRATRPLTNETLDVPESVRGVIRSKLDALEEGDRRALQYASIQGEEFLSTVLAGALAVDEIALEQRLDHLERVHRLIDTRGEEELPDGSLAIRYGFVHALYQNVLYESVLTKQRTMLHLRTGEQLARHYAEETPRVAGALAAHFERGRDYRRAVECLVQAADVATERYAAAVAEEHFSHALALVDRLRPDDRARPRVMLLQRRGTIRLGLGNLRGAKADFEQAAERARQLNDPVSEGAALNALANPFLSRWLGRAEDEMHRAQHALTVAERSGDATLRAEATVNLALRHAVMGEPAAAKRLFEEAVQLARSGHHPAALLRTLTYRGAGHFFQTEFREAEGVLSEAVELASRVHDGGMLRTGLFFLGWTRASLGRISEALATFERLREVAARNADSLFLARVPRRIAWIHRELQDFGYGESLDASRSDEPDDSGARSPDLMVPAFSGVRAQAKAAQVALANGDLDRTAELAAELLANSTRHGPPKYVATAHQLLADVAAARADLAAAERELTRALDVLTHYPAPLVQWKIYAALGRVRRQRDDAGGARAAFAQASEIVSAVAGSVADEALRRIFLTSPAVQEVFRECA